MKRRIGWPELIFAAGFVLGLVLLVEAVTTYAYVAFELVVAQQIAVAGRIVSRLEQGARDQAAAGPDALRRLLEDERRSLTGQLEWIRVADRDGEIVAATEGAPSGTLDERALRELLDRRALSSHRLRPPLWAPGLTVALPFRFQFENERALGLETRASGSPRFKLIEVALDPHGPRDPFWPLVRNLAVSAAAALALLVAMLTLANLAPRYARARRIEDQLDVARRVQARLLPRETPASDELDIAACCIPTWGVGGDFYDFFSTGGAVQFVTGDVSGKGLPAAIIAGAIHGAVRAAAGEDRDLAALAGRVNGYVEEQTDPNRFVSLVWGRYDVASRTLEYVNAGHLPPLLVRGGDGSRQVESLREGGPVLGLLPSAAYRNGHTSLSAGDVMVMYSDGVTEAAAPSGEEFGEVRLQHAVEAMRGASSAAVVQQLLLDIRRFAKCESFTDDLTLVVVRVL